MKKVLSILFAMLFVMATTNRSYVFDLAPGQSFVQFLLERGYDVYVIDWDPPRPDESKLRFADYVCDFIPSCVAEVQARSGEKEVSVVGYKFDSRYLLTWSRRE